jgi:hypothetical protein
MEEIIPGINDNAEKLLHLDSNKEKRQPIIITKFKHSGILGPN